MENQILERPAFLRNLLEEIDRFDETLFLPDHDMQDAIRTLGIITGWNRRLFSYWRMKSRERDRLEVELRHDLKNVELERQHTLAKYVCDVLKELFWLMSRQELGDWDAEAIGIRDGWRLVEIKPPEEKIRRLLGGLFESGPQ